MRAITIQQPWCWAIFRGGKDVENRRDRRGQVHARKVFNHLGPTLIHSSQRYAGPEAHRLVTDLSCIDPGDPGQPGKDTAWAFGSILGVVTVTGVHEADACYDPVTGRFCSPWAEPDAAHIQLATPRLLFHPIEHRGQLGSWQVTDSLVLSRIAREMSL